MSRVIRTTLWEEPCVIAPPPPPPKPVEEEEKPEDTGPKVDEEALTRMLADVAAKEQEVAKKLKEAEETAERTRQEAEDEREMQDAEADIQRQREEAAEAGRKQGYDEGYEEGLKKAREEMADAIKKANEKAEHTLATARDATEDYMKQADEDVAKVVMRVVEKILPQHFIDVPQVVLPAVRQAILKVRDQKEVNVHVPPDSYDIALMARDEFRTILTDGTAVLEFTSDESLSPGDCVIETPNGGVDARLATQIELLRQAVQGVLG